jgi:hypothetical protein
MAGTQSPGVDARRIEHGRRYQPGQGGFNTNNTMSINGMGTGHAVGRDLEHEHRKHDPDHDHPNPDTSGSTDSAKQYQPKFALLGASIILL